MNDYQPTVGRLCRSKAGRDRGRFFLIRSVVDDAYVTIVDGAMRKIAAPKKKKRKHLELKPQVAQAIAEKFANDAKVFDAEVRSAIQNLIEGNQ